MLCKILIINMLDYKFKRFIFNTKVNVIYDNYRISLTILSFLIRKSVLFLKFPYQILSQKRKLPLRPCQWHTLFLYQQSDAIAYK